MYVREIFRPLTASKFCGGALGAKITKDYKHCCLSQKWKLYSPASLVICITPSLSGPSPIELTALTVIV